MKQAINISDLVIRRLSQYRRVLGDLFQNNVSVVSSQKLSSFIGLTPSCVRQDLRNFGSFGVGGYGYNVKILYDQISALMGLDKNYKLIIIGAGHLGQAIVNNTYLTKSGLNITAMFDINPRLTGLKINNIEVYDYDKVDEYLANNKIEIGVITTNAESSNAVVLKLANSGVKGIWNFTAADLNSSICLPIQNVYLVIVFTN